MLFAEVLVIVVVGVIAVLFVTGRGGSMAAAPPDRRPGLPSGRLTGTDLQALRLDVVARGYRMSEVDAALDRLAAELDERDLELARLREALPDGGRSALASTPEDSKP